MSVVIKIKTNVPHCCTVNAFQYKQKGSIAHLLDVWNTPFVLSLLQNQVYPVWQDLWSRKKLDQFFMLPLTILLPAVPSSRLFSKSGYRASKMLVFARGKACLLTWCTSHRNPVCYMFIIKYIQCDLEAEVHDHDLSSFITFDFWRNRWGLT